MAGAGRRRGRLPRPVTPIVGREADVRDIELLLQRNRLVTLTGPGGSGKTRVALEVAASLEGDLPDGVIFVGLQDARDRDEVLAAVADALGITELVGLDLEERIEDHLADRRLLLVLDNFEQVLPAAPLVSGLLASAPGGRVLVTSRAPLRIAGEQEREVLPLDPGPASVIFAQRATAVRSTFDPTAHEAAIGAIVRRLDGLPLALELAAAQVRHLTPEAILARLEVSLPVLEGGPRDAPARQRTQRATLDWSHDLLSEPTRRLFGAVSVFVGGWTLEAAEHILGEGAGGRVLAGLAELVACSLVRAAETEAGGVRYSMHQLTGEFAAERLAASPDREAIERRHAEWVLRLVEEAEPHLVLTDLRRWQEALRADEDNIRKALRWAIDHGPDGPAATDLGLLIAGGLWRFWFHWAELREGVAWLEALLALPGAETIGIPRARGLSSLAALWWHQGRARESLDAYLEVVEILRSLGVDDERFGDALDDAVWAALLNADHGLAARLTEEKWRYPRRRGSHMFDGWVDRKTDLAFGGTFVPGPPSVEAIDTIRALEGILPAIDRSDQALFAAHARATIAGSQCDFGIDDRGDRHLREALRRYRDLGHLGQVPIMLATVAGSELVLGRPDRALRLAAAAGHREAELGGSVRTSPFNAGVMDPAREASALLPADEVARCIREGSAMSIDEAISYALRETRADLPARGTRQERFDLTPREEEVLALVADGRTDGEIAERLFISKKTASVHVASIKGKMGAGSRAEIVSLALRSGLVESPQG